MSTALHIPIDGLSRCMCPFLDSAISLSTRSPRALIPISRRPRITNNRAPSRFHTSPTASAKSGSSRRGHDKFSTQTIAKLHEKLKSAPALNENPFETTTEWVHYLITERLDKPSLVHYNAVVRINADAKLGSAAVVEELMDEMKDRGIQPNSEFYHNVLQVLAIHPDHLLRSRVLEEMKERWISLNPSGHHNLILGLLRDHQYEMALIAMEKAMDNSVVIPSHIYDIVTYVLLNIGEIDTALLLTQSRVAKNGTGSISANLWDYMLSNCASALHYPGVKYIWRKRVQFDYLNPSDGVCEAILNTASRNNDPDLATDVIRVLANRKVKMDFHHYEALLEAYVGVGDIQTAMRILCIMKKAKLAPDSASVRSIVFFLRKPENSQHLQKSWAILKDLKAQGHSIPVAACNAVLEASASELTWNEAWNAYKELHLICNEGPNTKTFEILFKGVRIADNGLKEKKAMAIFLAAEMQALKIEPSALTYDRIILICITTSEHADPDAEVADQGEIGGEVHEAGYEDALRYYDEMKLVGGVRKWRLRRGTYAALIRACARRDPERAWALLEEMEEEGIYVDRLRELLGNVRSESVEKGDVDGMGMVMNA